MATSMSASGELTYEVDICERCGKETGYLYWSVLCNECRKTPFS